MRKKLGLFIVAITAVGFTARSAEAGTLTSVSIAVSNSAPSAAATVTLSYTTATALVAGDNLILGTLPTGFIVTDTFSLPFCNSNITVSLNGTPTSFTTLGTSFCGTFAGPNLQINTGIGIAAGTNVVITLSSAIVQNPATPGLYTMGALRTGTSSGATIDAPLTLPSVTITAGPAPTQSVPTLSLPGQAGLALLFMAGGIAMLRRRRSLV